MRKDLGLPRAGHSHLQPVSVDPLLAKAECVSDAGSGSLKTYLRKSKRRCAATVRVE